MSEHLPAPDINPDNYFCDLCASPISMGIETKCNSCQITHEYIIKPLKAHIKALEGVIKEWFATYPCSDEPESYYENDDCEYCSVVKKMYRVLSKLEEV